LGKRKSRPWSERESGPETKKVERKNRVGRLTEVNVGEGT